ncbi:MAG TPA: hypothetical protein VGB70_13155 [Allosphingosinicella sp.]|jgi:hypothetical protein
MAVQRGRAKGRAARDAVEARGVRERIDGFTPEKEVEFLSELERSGAVADAARAVGISRTTISRHRRYRPAFEAACKLARAKARGPLEAIAYLRAVEGAETKIIRKGKVVEVRVRPSDGMLKTLMQAADPEKYGRVGGASPAQVEAIRKQILEEQNVEPTEAERMEVVERLLRKLRKLRQRMIREGCGLTVEGDLVPKGYGPIAPDAVPMIEDPIGYTLEQEVADFMQRTAERERLQQERGLG